MQTENSGELSVHSAHMPDSNYHNTEFKERPDTEAGGKPIAMHDFASLIPVFTCFSFLFSCQFCKISKSFC